MSQFDAQAYYTQHYSSATAADWEGMYERGDWPSAIYRLPAEQTPRDHGHGVVYHLLQGCAPFKRTLDIGCGSGDFILPIRGMAQESYGVDIASFPGAWQVLERAHGIHCQTHDLDKADLPFPDGHFSALTMIMVLEHVLVVEHAVREIARVLEPGGVAVVQVPNLAYLKRRIDLLLGRLPITADTSDAEFIHAWDGQHLHHFTLDALRMVMGRHGLWVEKCHCFGRLAQWRSHWTSLLGADLTVLVRKTALKS
jgi:SAM-dependent methyltransferase